MPLRVLVRRLRCRLGLHAWEATFGFNYATRVCLSCGANQIGVHDGIRHVFRDRWED